MPTLWLVDSSAWIFALRPRPVVSIEQRVDELLAQNRLLMTGIVELEVLSGLKTEKEFREFNALFEGLQRIKTRESDWAQAAEMAFDLRRAGYTLPLTDVLIGYQARRVDAGILHADRDFTVLCRHFRIEQEDFSKAVSAGGGR